MEEQEQEIEGEMESQQRVAAASVGELVNLFFSPLPGFRELTVAFVQDDSAPLSSSLSEPEPKTARPRLRALTTSAVASPFAAIAMPQGPSSSSYHIQQQSGEGEVVGSLVSEMDMVTPL